MAGARRSGRRRIKESAAHAIAFGDQPGAQLGAAAIDVRRRIVPRLVSLVVGTQGLSLDEAILGPMLFT